MSSTRPDRSSGALPTVQRPQYGGFPSSGSRAVGTEDKPSHTSSLSQNYGSGSAWQASSGIWGSGTIGSGFTSAKRDASRSRASDSDGNPDGRGSSVLTATSEADTWNGRANGPWNQIDTTSPTISTSHSGSNSPVRHRGSIAGIGSQTVNDMSNPTPYSFSRQTGQTSAFGRPQSKSSLDPSSGKFMPTFSSYLSDDKENGARGKSLAGTAFNSEGSFGYRPDQRNAQLAGHSTMTNGTTRDSSTLPPPRHSEYGLGRAGNAPSAHLSHHNSFSAFGHTPSNSISHRPSFSGRAGSISHTLNHSHSDMDSQLLDPQLTADLARFTLGGVKSDLNSNQQHNTTASSYPSPSQVPTLPHQGRFKLNAQSPMWNGPQSSGSRSMDPFSADGYTKSSFSSPYQTYNSGYANGRGSVSPSGSDMREIGSQRYHSVGGTPLMDPEQVYRADLRDPRSHVANPTYGDRKAQAFQTPQHQPNPYLPSQHAMYNQFPNQYGAQAYDYASQTAYPPTSPGFRLQQNSPLPYGYPVPMPHVQLPGAYSHQHVPNAPRGPREQEIGHGVRSALMEEFRSNMKSSRRYELRDIYNHVVEFSGDQHGSRFIQQKLETANSDEKEQIFREIQPNALQLMTDVFGNYVIQKLFEHGNQVQKRVLAEQMKNHVVELSLQMYGCRVVQKALEHVLADQQAGLIKELQPEVLKCVKDQNGNHVIQKAIERVPSEHIQFIILAFKGQVHTLATHSYGCRVIQRMLEFCSEKDQASVLSELHACAQMLITDQFGNYVTQHVIEKGKPDDRAMIIRIVTSQLLVLSKHKFASNVVEKSIQYSTDEQRKEIISQLTIVHGDGSCPLQLLMKDQYGNYVIQKLLAHLKGTEREQFVEDIKPQLVQFKKSNYGKQIQAIEKLIFNGAVPNYDSVISAPPSADDDGNGANNEPGATVATDAAAVATHKPIEQGSDASTSLPMDIQARSEAPTPGLTMDQNSPQSSSLPSTNVSTADGPTGSSSTTTTTTSTSTSASNSASADVAKDGETMKTPELNIESIDEVAHT